MKDIHFTETVLRFSDMLATFLSLNVQKMATNCERKSTILNNVKIDNKYSCSTLNAAEVIQSQQKLLHNIKSLSIYVFV